MPWWHGVIEATCIVIQISGPLPSSSRKKRRGDAFGLEQPEDSLLFGEPPSSGGGRRGGGGEREGGGGGAKKGMKTLLVDSAFIRD